MKSDQETVEKRVEEIADLRLLGATPTNIRQYGAEQNWEVTERQIYRYIGKADKLIAKSVERKLPKLIAFHHAARRALYARTMAVSDYGTAARVLKDEAELLGLYAPKKFEATGKDGAPLGGSDSDNLERTRSFVLAALSAISDAGAAQNPAAAPDLRSDVRPQVEPDLEPAGRSPDGSGEQPGG